MILYYSGTGNSAHAAKYMGELLEDTAVNLFNRIRNHDYSTIYSDRPWIVASPVYCWQLPRLVRDWMLQTEFTGSKDIYFVLTCGSEVGNAEKYLRKLCAQKGLNYKGCLQVQMPENYIAMFDSPDERVARIQVKKADRVVKKAAVKIMEGEQLPAIEVKFMDKLKSSFVNWIYYPVILKDKKFYVEETCTGCGLCMKKCPLGNIEMIDGKPQWKGNCTHCMACISYCPTEAIEYGKISKGKRRHTCE